MRILIVTDAWHPQVNGVVTTMENTIDRLRAKGHQCTVIEPSNCFATSSGYKEIRVAINPWTVGKLIEKTAADSIHIVTEGPLGIGCAVFLQAARVEVHNLPSHASSIFMSALGCRHWVPLPTLVS